MSKTCTRFLYGTLAVALLLGGAGGTAIAKGKIKGNQIAPGAIATKHLKKGSVTRDKLAPGAVSADQLAPNSVTGALVDESTLGRVPDTAAVAGAKVTPISLRMPNTQATPVQVAAGPGWTLALDCDTTQAVASMDKTGTSSLVTVEGLAPGTAPTFGVFKNTGSLTFAPTSAGHIRVVAVTAGTESTEVELTMTFAAGQFTSQTDCFFSGTVTATP